MNESPTLERQRELDAIRHVLDEARAGRGGLLVIEGPSGIGKSRLVAEARDLALESGLDVLHARGGELERDYPFGVVLRLLEARFARSSEEEGRPRSGRLATTSAPSRAGRPRAAIPSSCASSPSHCAPPRTRGATPTPPAWRRSPRSRSAAP